MCWFQCEAPAGLAAGACAGNRCNGERDPCRNSQHAPACRVLDFFKRNFRSVKPYDRGAVLGRMPFELRSRILQHLYMDTIKVLHSCTARLCM